jgi:hypothetical protein
MHRRRRQLQVDHCVGVPVDYLPAAAVEAEQHRGPEDLLLSFGMSSVEHVGAFDGNGVRQPPSHVFGQVLEADDGAARAERAKAGEEAATARVSNSPVIVLVRRLIVGSFRRGGTRLRGV